MNEILWFTSRATGIVSIVLLTFVLVGGMVIAARRRPHDASPTIWMALHRWVSLGMVVFLLIHIVTAIAETFVSIDWISFVVPFTSGYEPLWVGLGTLSFDLLVAVVVTSVLRRRLPARTWQAVHYLSYGLWALAVVHGFALGTATEWVLRLVTATCGLVGLVAIGWRVTTGYLDRQRRPAVASQEWS